MSPTPEEIAAAEAFLSEQIQTPVGVSISTGFGQKWPVFRFAEMENPDDDRTVGRICEALETILRSHGIGEAP